MFRELGDQFAPHVVENPDEESELTLLRNYAPHVPEETLRKLSSAFQDLRELVNDGKLQYPYSTRELVNAVRWVCAGGGGCALAETERRRDGEG